MLRRVLASSRYIVLIAVATTLVASIALLVYQAAVAVSVVTDLVQIGWAPKSAKPLAASIVEMMDVFLIAIVALIMCLGFYSLFVDHTLPLPRWLKIDDLEDLKNHLVSVVIVVLAVLFLREAVERAEELELLKLGVSLSLMIAALTFFLTMKVEKKR